MDKTLTRAHSISIYEESPSLTIECMRNETYREAAFLIQEDLSGIGGVIYQIRRNDETIVTGLCEMDKEAHLVSFRIPLNAITETGTLISTLVFYTADAPFYDEQLASIFNGTTMVFVEDADSSDTSTVGSAGIISSFPFYLHVNNSNIDSESTLETALTDMLTQTARCKELADNYERLLSNLENATTAANNAAASATTAAGSATSATTAMTSLQTEMETLNTSMSTLYNTVKDSDFGVLTQWRADVEASNTLVFIEDEDTTS